ncbi:MAG: ROK family protein [Olegusella sp.]|nr:ROK family protein [Olegusella sp.]
MAYVLGIDIGGTSIKAGLFDEEGTLLDIAKIKTTELVNEEAFNIVNAGLDKLLEGKGATPADVVAVGLDVPGPVDAEGKVGVLANISLDADGLQDALRAHFTGAALAFVNDANAAAMGEVWQGGAKDVDNCVMVTLGTGVGGGVICNGKLVAGAFGAGGEIGHINMNPDETLHCGCGKTGHLEQYASAKGIVRLYREACERTGQEPVHIEHETDTISVFNALAAGDPCAKETIDKMTDTLGRALAIISAIVDPEVVLVGGGVAGAWGVLGPMVTTAFRKYCFPASAACRISAATLGNEAGMYGAAYCAIQAR